MWNHRIIRHIDPRANMDDSIYYAIHEVYYDEDGKVKGWTLTQDSNPSKKYVSFEKW